MGSDWKELPFTEAVQVNPKVSLKKGQVYPFVDMKAVDPSWRNASESEYRIFKNGGARFMPYDTLMARITPCLENGKIARYIPKINGNGPAFGSTEFIVIRGREGVTNNDFAYYLTKWQEFRQFAIAQMTGSSGRQRVPADSLAGFSVPVPELDEQRAIDHILGSLDDKIELNRQMNRTLEKMAQAIFKSWFIDFDPVRAKADGRDPGLPKEIADLFPDSFEDSELGPIPKGWKVGSVYGLASVEYGAPFKSKLFNTDGLGLPLIRIRDLKTHSPQNYTEEKHPKGTLVFPGDIIVGMDGEFRAVLWQGEIGWLNQRVCMFKPLENVPKAYVYYGLQKHLDFFEKTKTGTTVIHLGKGDIDSFKMIIPAIEVMSRFSKIADKCIKKIVENGMQNRILSSLRDTLLPQLISGKLRVPDAKKFIEETL